MEKNTASRRQFIQTCGLLGLSVAAGAALPAVAGAARIGGEHTVTQTRLQMGTLVTLTAVHTSRLQAEEALGRAFEEIDRLAAVFSRYDSTTPVYVLNRDGRVSGIGPELKEVMDRALRFGSLTDNAFNITVKPVVDLFSSRQNLAGCVQLSQEDVSHALSLVDARGVQLGRDSIRLQREGMGVTLDGIAKGYIVDKASSVLSACGVRNHMINAGGDIRTSGEKAGGKPWVIAIQDPDKKRNYPATIALRDGAIATSGGYEVFYDRKRMYSHLVSPATGSSPHSVLSVSVTAPTVMEADTLATAVYVMQARSGLQFMDSLTGRECLILGRNGAAYTSRNWAKA
jgi:thiamine biosynthesis lipoprotein